MKVTFDSNAWELIVFPERHPNNRDHGSMVKIKEVLRNGQIQGFICESFGTLEAILPTDRAAYLANKIPIVETSVTSLRGGSASISIRIESDHSLHPGLHERQVEKLEEALAIGMRLLSAPYFNQPLPPLFRNNPAIYAPEVFSTADYNERFGSAVSEIHARGVGDAVLAALVKKISQRLGPNRPAVKWEIQLLEYAYTNAKNPGEKREIEKAVAESADGDAVAAHIAFGNDLFCTEDQGNSAGGPSIFNATNRAWLKATHGVNFVTMKELAALLP